MLVLISLLFTIIIFNSYSAFITSVLSVRLDNIRTVDDLLKSDYDIGYAKNNEDEVYLRVSNLFLFKKIVQVENYSHPNQILFSLAWIYVTKRNHKSNIDSNF